MLAQVMPLRGLRLAQNRDIAAGERTSPEAGSTGGWCFQPVSGIVLRTASTVPGVWLASYLVPTPSWPAWSAFLTQIQLSLFTCVSISPRGA